MLLILHSAGERSGERGEGRSQGTDKSLLVLARARDAACGPGETKEGYTRAWGKEREGRKHSGGNPCALDLPTPGKAEQSRAWINLIRRTAADTAARNGGAGGLRRREAQRPATHVREGAPGRPFYRPKPALARPLPSHRPQATRWAATLPEKGRLCQPSSLPRGRGSTRSVPRLPSPRAGFLTL